MALLQLDDLMAKPAPRPQPVKEVDVTPAAVERVKQMLDAQPERAGQGLRIYVTSGGCAGYSYGMAFDSPSEDDTVIEQNGLQVLLDPDSLKWLRGVRVDYAESLLGSGFAITNPNVNSTCGCGTSFSKDDGATPADTGSCR